MVHVAQEECGGDNQPPFKVQKLPKVQINIHGAGNTSIITHSQLLSYTREILSGFVSSSLMMMGILQLKDRDKGA